VRTISTPDATDAYDALAPFYDRFTGHHDYGLWMGGLLALSYAHGLCGTRALDAGCGTGKSFMPLLERGFEVTACDRSAAMLDVAASKLGHRQVTLHQRDLRSLEPIGQFDLITCLDDVANYLSGPEELTVALAGLADNLRPGGLLVFDANTIATYRGFFAQSAVLEQERLLMVWRGLAGAEFDAGGLAEAVLDVFHENGHGWSRTTSRHAQRHHPQPCVERCIEGAGLQRVAVYGQDPAVNFDSELDELRHSKAIYLVTR